ncbi:MAG: DUF4962 domain-containing protein [Gemmatimonadota bacterium]|nr:DUF4962 domain-containing protein [Gemmatimonadota bacterium]
MFRLRFFLCVMLVLPAVFFCSRLSESSYLGLEVAEPAPEGRHLLHYPADGAEAGVNPPGFTWTGHESAADYRFVLFSRSEGGKVCLTQEGLASSVALLKKPLEPGDYSWLVVYRDSAGQDIGRSRLRKFNLAEGLPVLVMPDMARLEKQLAGVRPRLFLTPPALARVKEAIEAGRMPFWEFCCQLADSALAEPLYPEPAPYKDGKFEASEWRRIYTPGKVGSAHIVRLALVWKITGERKYLEGAKKWLVNLAGWDPNGITSYNLLLPDGSHGNDEAGMAMLERMAIGYDWIGDELAPEEKELVLSSLRERGNQMLDYYTRKDFISAPWSNHAVRALAFTGLAGLATLGDLPEAGKWLDYVIRCYLTSFPTWGSDDGGWSQGLSYWSAYVLWQTNFIDALQLCSDVDLYKKPFFRNNGYFAVNFHPPYAPRGGFGDHGEASPSQAEKLLIKRYARAYNDPVLLWQAQNIRHDENHLKRLQAVLADRAWNEWFMEDVVDILSTPPSGLEPRSPAGLPQAKLLRDIGWAAMHSDLGSADNDVWALFKSSSYGSFSHSHADQNSFQVNAFGQALLIDSGYYPWYGSPHHNLWTRRTKAHNSILINGRGQSYGTMAASGTIEEFEHTGRLTVVTGECARAYNLPQSEGTVEQWKEHLDEPLPGMDPEALVVRRTMVFSHQREKTWIAAYDYLGTAGPATFDYMLHALEKMQLDPEGRRLFVRSGEAGLDVYFLSSEGLDFQQSDKFPIAPEDRCEGAPNQWHFTARTVEKTDRMRYLVLMVPRRLGEGAGAGLGVKRLDYGNVRGFQVGEEKVLAWWGEGERGDFSPAGMAGQGRLMVEYSEKGSLKQKLIQ